tara:strand:- start:290 stop:928 length:639 start_codon:yes stop_codon:yes gene_type:complete
MAIKLVSVANVRTYLNFSSTNQDTLIGELIEQVSEDIQNYCDRLFTAATDELEYPVGGGQYLSLKRFPITTITHIRYNIDSDFSDSADDISSDDYKYAASLKDQGLVFYKRSKLKVQLSNITYASGYVWPDDPDSLQVKYTGGYGNTAGVLNVPDDLKKACVIQVSYLFDRRKSLGTSNVSGQEGSLNYENVYNFLPNVLGMIDKYKRYALV